MAQAAYVCDTLRAREWLEQAQTDLREGRIQGLIRQCQRQALKPAAAGSAHKTMTYFQHN